MASVPDTSTFSLQDVVDAVLPSTDDLLECFNDAIPWKFDPRHVGTHDDMLEFRNYGGVKDDRGIRIEHTTLYGAHPTWSTLRTLPTGVIDTDTFKHYVYVDGTNITIKRVFVEFDLSHIPYGAECTEAIFFVSEMAVHGTTEIAVLKGTQHSPVITGDFDEFTFDDHALGPWPQYANTAHNQGGYYRVVETNDTQRAFIGSLFGTITTFKVVVLEKDHDNDDVNPGYSKFGFDLFKAGEVIVPNGPGPPALNIKYR